MHIDRIGKLEGGSGDKEEKVEVNIEVEREKSGPDPIVTAFGNAKQHGYITVGDKKCIFPGNLEHDKVKEMLNLFISDSSKVDKKFTDKIVNRRKLVAPTTTKWFGISKDEKYKPSMKLVPKPVAEVIILEL